MSLELCRNILCCLFESCNYLSSFLIILQFNSTVIASFIDNFLAIIDTYDSDNTGKSHLTVESFNSNEHLKLVKHFPG